jgi:hypothetical protein
VHFTSTDGSATLPVNYTFTAGDAGVHTFPAGVILRTAGSQVITVTDTVTPTITGSKGVTVGPPTPLNLVASASTTTQVGLTWLGSGAATQYEVLRASTPGAFTTIGTSGVASYSDTTAAAGVSYVYKVRALDASSRRSQLSAPDIATTILFTDDPLVASSTRIKSAHVTQLRQAVNAVRACAGLPAATFTDPTLSPSIKMKAVHLQELRDALSPVRTALGLSTIPYTDPTLTANTTRIKAQHVQDLRTGVR